MNLRSSKYGAVRKRGNMKILSGFQSIANTESEVGPYIDFECMCG